MKKKVMGVFLLAACLLLPASVSYADNDVVDIDAIRQRIEKEVRMEYADDIMYQMQIAEFGRESAEEMIQQVIERRLAEYLGEKEFSIDGHHGSLYYCYLPAIPMPGYPYDYYCGPACTLQTLYGLGKADQVEGDNDVEKQHTLAANMGTDPDKGTYVYRIVMELNKYIDILKYAYTEGVELTQSQFKSYVALSLYYDRPVILWANTLYLQHYQGYQIKHYVCLDFLDYAYDEVRIVDPYNGAYGLKYYGYWLDSVEHAYQAIGVAVNGLYGWLICS